MLSQNTEKKYNAASAPDKQEQRKMTFVILAVAYALMMVVATITGLALEVRKGFFSGLFLTEMIAGAVAIGALVGYCFMGYTTFALRDKQQQREISYRREHPEHGYSEH